MTFWPDEQSERLAGALSLVSDDELITVYLRVRDDETLRRAVRREYVARYVRDLAGVPADERAKLLADLEAKQKLSIAERWQYETLKGKNK